MTATNVVMKKTETTVLHAPLSGFEFCRIFTNDDYFIMKLYHICDKANVPHHIVDDILICCKNAKSIICSYSQRIFWNGQIVWNIWKNISTVLFLVISLERFSSNHLHYSRSYRDSAEIIWYDFKHQAIDW